MSGWMVKMQGHAIHWCGYDKPRSKQEWVALFMHCDQQDSLRTMQKPCGITNVDYDEVREMRDMLIGETNG